MTEKLEDGVQVPPPSYHEVVQPPLHPPGPRPGDCLLEVVGEGARPDQELGTERLEVTCRACHRQVVTRVEDQIKPEGWFFAICCFFCGSWCASCLVCCLPGFKKFTHFCPACGSVVNTQIVRTFLLIKLCSRALIGVAEPSHSCLHIFIIVFVSILVIALILFYFKTKGY